jgi:TRAP-type mannitol/chloroaromatic compound transport system substrate-binding protein
MKRKEFLKKGLITGLGATALASSCTNKKSESADLPNINLNKVRRWKMVTTWPPGFPVLGEAAEYYADWVEKMSAGRIKIRVFGGGELVPALEAFDTVSSATVEMGCGAAYYWAGKSSATQFFSAVPFGMNARQMTSWLLAGEGMDLWREVYAQFNLMPLPGGNTGVQMGGWFNKEIATADDLKGLKMRIPGLGGRVIEKAGGAAILVAGGEIFTSLERGVIDAAEWIGPYHDYRMGFHRIAKYYYYPGWHEPCSQLEFFVNKTVFDDLPEDLQAILEAASERLQAWVLAEFDVQNAIHLQKLKDESDVEIRSFSDDVLATLRELSEETIQEVIGSDPLSRKVFESYKAHMKASKAFLSITEQPFYNRILK